MASPTPFAPPIVNVLFGVLIGILGLGPQGPATSPDPTSDPVAGRDLVVATWNVPEGDLVRARKLDVSTIVAPVTDASHVRPLLREAASLDLKVILFIRDPGDPESPAPPR
jgi:hypothetical protein